jgi:hypothetical protein
MAASIWSPENFFPLPLDLQASDVEFTPTPTVASTNVQDAIVEVDTEVRALANAALAAATTVFPDPAGNAGKYLSTDGSNILWSDVGTSFTQAGTGAVSRTTQNKLREWVSVLDFGAVADYTPGSPSSGTDNTAAFHAAFAASRFVYIPEGNYKCNALTITRRIHLFGAGSDTSKIYSTVASPGNALNILPPAGVGGTENRFFYFHDFGIEPTVATGGRDGIYCELASGAFMSNSVIERCYVGDFGRYGIHLNNNPYSNLDGFFTWTIRRNWITNGLYIQKGGDSITVAENTITGKNVGIFLTGLSGARQVMLRDNNITTAGGALAASGTEQLSVYNNQMEMLASAYTGAYSSWVYIANSYMPTLRDNTITAKTPSVTTPPAVTIQLDGTTAEALLDNNYIHIGTTYHIGIAPTVTSTRLMHNNRYAIAYTGAAPLIDDQGIDTSGTLRNCTGFMNSWVQYDAVNQPVKVTKDSTGWIAMTGAVSGGTSGAGVLTRMFTLPAGCRPNNLKFFSVAARSGTTWGTAVLQVDTAGAVWNYGVTSNSELHLNGVCFRLDPN